MSVHSELYNLFHSIPADSLTQSRTRSGDVEGDGAELWNYIGCVQSAESDIIDEEEREEQRQAKRKFARLLGLYYKKILSPGELRFLAACMKTDKTPYAVGRSLGVDYVQTIAEINAKHENNLPKLLQLMRVCGYDCRRELSFMPQLNYYVKRTLQKRQAVSTYKRRHPERAKETFKKWCETHKAERAGSWSRWWATLTEEKRQAHRDRVNARRAANREKYNAFARAWNKAHAEAKREASRRYYQNLTPEQRALRRERQRIAAQRYREKKKARSDYEA